MAASEASAAQLQAQQNSEPMAQKPQSVLIIEDESDLHQLIASPVESLYSKIDLTYATSGTDAWREAEKHNFDLILTDWKLEDEVSGLVLLNRFRQHPLYRKTPIIVMSSFLSDHDFNLLKEFNFTASILKPFHANTFQRILQETYAEALWFSQKEDYLAEFINKVGSISENIRLEREIDQFLENCPRPVPILLLCARLLREQKKYKQAVSFAQRANQFRPGSLNVECELGKLYLQLGELDKAQQYLAKSLDQSPNNLERLCDLGKLNLENLNTQKARAYFSRAAEIDPENKTSSNGLQLVEHIEHFFQTNNPTNIPDTFAGLLNAVGIGLVRSGNLEKGAEHYQSALEYIHDDDLKCRVCFNLGLAYLRFSRWLDAREWLKKATELNSEHSKSQAYLQKVEEIINKNKKSVVAEVKASADKPQAEEEADNQPESDEFDDFLFESDLKDDD